MELSYKQSIGMDINCPVEIGKGAIGTEGIWPGGNWRGGNWQEGQLFGGRQLDMSCLLLSVSVGTGTSLGRPA